MGTKNKRQDATISNTIISKYLYENSFDKELDFSKKLEYQNYKDGRVDSSFNRGVLFEKEMEKIRHFIQECLDDYVLNILKGGELIISQSWVGRQEKGQSVEPHTHISEINGCFYFTVPDKETPLVFNRQNQLGFMDDFSVPVNGGELVLFPNKLEHWVPENKNNQTRYVIGFNSRNPSVIKEWTKIASFYSKDE